MRPLGIGAARPVATLGQPCPTKPCKVCTRPFADFIAVSPYDVNSRLGATFKLSFNAFPGQWLAMGGVLNVAQLARVWRKQPLGSVGAFIVRHITVI